MSDVLDTASAGARAELAIRQARREDVPALAAMFASDALGRHGDTSDRSALPDYLAAFDWIAGNADNSLRVVAMDRGIVGTFQTTFVRTMTGRGSASLIIEAVHTRRDGRGGGIGAAR